MAVRTSWVTEMPEVNRSAPLEIEDATPAKAAPDDNEVHGPALSVTAPHYGMYLTWCR
jgi:hypothetical protein